MDKVDLGEREVRSRALDCCLPGGPCHESGLADVQHRYEPSTDVRRVIEWLRTEPAEFIAYVNESFGASSLADAIERGAHLSTPNREVSDA